MTTTKRAKKPSISACRKKLVSLAWTATHRDFRGVTNGEKTILTLTKNGTCLVSVSSLSDEELLSKLPTASRLAYEAYCWGVKLPPLPRDFKAGSWKDTSLWPCRKTSNCKTKSHIGEKGLFFISCQCGAKTTEHEDIASAYREWDDSQKKIAA